MTKKILLIAPHPFFQERGTPIAVDLLIRALTELGHEIDLLTFNEGSDVNYPGLTIFRVRPWLKIENVRPGFSAKKLVLDFFLFFKFIKLFFKHKYEVVHAVEESVFMAMIVCPLRKVPYIYDMDSSMVTQLIDKISSLRKIERILRWFESLPMKRATMVIPVCQALANEVLRYRKNNVHILKDVSLADQGSNAKTTCPVLSIRSHFEITGPILMYIGNLESYQGVDLLIESFSLFIKNATTARLVIIGGSDEDIEKYKSMSSSKGLEQEIIFIGRQPISQINEFMTQADILVSPRIHGVNTAMKLYSYLDSGIPVLATNLPTHTQVVDSSHCMLADPDPKAFASGLETLSTNEQLRTALSKNAKQLIAREHSYPAFKNRLTSIYQSLP